MKKILSLAAFAVAGITGTVCASSPISSPADCSTKTNGKETVQQQSNECKFIEFKVVEGDCLYRECTVTTQQGPDGNTYTEKTCTPWVSIPCPTNGPQKPVLSLG